MNKALVGLSIFPNHQFLQACLPLFEKEIIEVLEWSFDQIEIDNRPQWLNVLLKEYSAANRLLAHGVHYSGFSGQLQEYHDDWINRWKLEQQHLKFNHLSEHIGFKSELARNFGFPLPFEYDRIDLQFFLNNLLKLKQATSCRLGFENLALAFSASQVLSQGKFLKKICDEIDAFIVLDLHNLYCQSLNFGIDIHELIDSYPIEYVEEIHISGGSNESSQYDLEQVRRDTHNNEVPTVLFGVLAEWLPRFTSCKYIIFEQLPESLGSVEAMYSFQKDYERLINIRDQYAVNIQPRIEQLYQKEPVIYETTPGLFDEQKQLAKLLYQNNDPLKLQSHRFQFFHPHEWSLSMIETAMLLSKKWNKAI